MKNDEIAHILKNISIYLQMKDENIFKVKAYDKGAYSIESLNKELEDIYKKGGIEALTEISGIGRAISEKIEELLLTGKLEYYEDLKKKIPVDLDTLRRIEGIGPKTILILYKKLKIKNVKDLEKAAKSKKIRELDGFQEKTEENILKGIKFLKKSKGRYIMGHTYPLLQDIERRLQKLPYVERTIIAGSSRRKKETIGDGDILVISNDPEKVMDYFTKLPEVINIIGKGSTKSSVKLENGLDVDLRVVKEKSYGAALNYFTGSKDHNVELRKIAIKKGLKLNEYGLTRRNKQVAGKTEEEIYKKLDLNYIEPEIRENRGEIEVSRKNKLPKLIPYKSLKGDLQVQTRWTDGAHSIEEMALEAKKYGLEYIVITDHTKSLAMTGGLDEKKLEKQGKEIDKINKKIDGITILKGSEVDILKNGSLDINDKGLSKLDVVGISVHSNFKMSKNQMTERIIKAMENKHVDIFFHPTGRIIQKREPYEVDMEQIIQVAKDTKTILEIDAYPDRSDLKDDHIKMAVDEGVKMCIDSDAHNKNDYKFLEYGIAQARRGWATKNDIINAWPLKKMLKMLK